MRVICGNPKWVCVFMCQYRCSSTLSFTETIYHFSRDKCIIHSYNSMCSSVSHVCATFHFTRPATNSRRVLVLRPTAKWHYGLRIQVQPIILLPILSWRISVFRHTTIRPANWKSPQLCIIKRRKKSLSVLAKASVHRRLQCVHLFLEHDRRPSESALLREKFSTLAERTGPT